MRYRDYKTFAPGNYYHVFNRGNGKSDIFLEPQDYEVFMHRIRENFFPDNESPKELSPLDIKYQRKLLPSGAFSLITYCLMPNHFHLLVRQNGDVKISKLMLKLCTGYAKYFQKKCEHTGHLLQGPFKAIHIENEAYLIWLSAYIHQNPVTAGLVKNPEDYLYSSYLEYIGKSSANLCEKNIILERFKNVDDYKKFVNDSGILIAQKKEIQDLLLD